MKSKEGDDLGPARGNLLVSSVFPDKEVVYSLHM